MVQRAGFTVFRQPLEIFLYLGVILIGVSGDGDKLPGVFLVRRRADFLSPSGDNQAFGVCDTGGDAK